MHSTLNRAQAVFGFFTTVALVVAGLAALSVLLYPTDGVTSQVQLRDVKVIKGRPHYYSTRKEEYAQLRFDLDADLTPLFNWNTKQLFVYVYAAYPSDPTNASSSAVSHAVVWDTILSAPESAYSFAALKERFFPPASAAKRKSGGKSTAGRKAPASSKKTAGKAAKGTAAAPGILRLRDQKAKYQIGDVSGRMAERENVTLAVGWNVQPWVGALWWSPGSGSVPRTMGGVGASPAFDLPALRKVGAAAAAQQQQQGKKVV
ncbi:putative microsomal signal peptidase subunit [Aspergillus japonicus CBS 114.51]|uniref:Signal peptidase subunit 3 n=1 Tax=Aspergillus japonicus CBS 114.51 TaxID=1448312 RepID=A0A8T8WY33_ASPJA|nr:putative microsomal signal peptidase subunit [Aspergillus japonicus CBS 114.51]RAH80564.1 putative microsomal signal peptidase subunit [Aspergillus japonicus CBS 114.51]